MGRLTCAALVLLTWPCAGLTDDADFCLLLNRVAAEQKLGDYSDDHLKLALCMAATATSLTGAGRDPTTEQLCVLSTEYLTREFKRRFPEHNPAAAIAGCQQKE